MSRPNNEITCGFVAVVGRPNCGKSTIVNTVLDQQLCVVTPLPQTTRRNLRGIYSTAEAQIIFVDTPGVHRGAHRFNAAMLEESRALLDDQTADVVVYVVDLYRDFGPEEDMVAAKVQASPLPTLIVFNKADICADVDGTVRAFFRRYPGLVARPHLALSAQAPESKHALLKALLPLVPTGPRLFPEDDLTDENMRFFAAEYLLKGIILSTQAEVPHAAFVEITDYREQADRHVVSATIHVESEGQKGIIIGKGGTKIGKIRLIAESEMSRLAGVPVAYTCHVRVSPGWRDDPRFLKSMGVKGKK